MGKNFSITNVGNYSHHDSASLIKIDDIKILNLNDCAINDSSQIEKLKKFVKKIDVLMMQFSYANWQGDKNNLEKMKNIANEIKKSLIEKCNIFKPDFFFPFASFVYFSHEENFFQNYYSNNISEICDEIKKKKLKTNSIVTIGEMEFCLKDCEIRLVIILNYKNIEIKRFTANEKNIKLIFN